MNLPGEFKINGRFQILIDHVEEVTQEQAEELNKEFQNLTISVNREAGIFSHIREATGEPKVGYKSAADAMRVLDEMRRKYPDKTFEAYLCTHCSEFHIGTLQEINPVKPAEEQKYQMKFPWLVLIQIILITGLYSLFVPQHNGYTLVLLVLILTLMVWYDIRRFKKFRQ